MTLITRLFFVFTSRNKSTNLNRLLSGLDILTRVCSKEKIRFHKSGKGLSCLAACVCWGGMPAQLLEPVWGYAGEIDLHLYFHPGFCNRFTLVLQLPSFPVRNHASAMRRNTLGQVAQHQFMTKPTVTWGCAPTTRGSFGREKSPQHNQLNICCISLLYCYIHILEAYRQNMTASVMPFGEISTWPSSHLPSHQRGKQHPSGFQQPRAKAIQRVLGGDTWNGWVAHTWQLNG